MVFVNTTPYKSPCQGCELRKVGCHCHCDKYLEYRSLLNNYHDSKESDKDFKRYNSEKIEKALAKSTKKRKHFRT